MLASADLRSPRTSAVGGRRPTPTGHDRRAPSHERRAAGLPRASPCPQCLRVIVSVSSSPRPPGLRVLRDLPAGIPASLLIIGTTSAYLRRPDRECGVQARPRNSRNHNHRRPPNSRNHITTEEHGIHGVTTRNHNDGGHGITRMCCVVTRPARRLYNVPFSST